MADPIRLIDGDQMHRRHPGTFHVPPRRDQLRLGDLAKLAFRTPDDVTVEAERMWVQVDGILVEGSRAEAAVRYAGALNNAPIYLDLEPGTRVVFEPRHVIDVDRGQCIRCHRTLPAYDSLEELIELGWQQHDHPSYPRVQLTTCPLCLAKGS